MLRNLEAKLGGLVEFYRSPARVAWTPTRRTSRAQPRASLSAEYCPACPSIC